MNNINNGNYERMPAIGPTSEDFGAIRNPQIFVTHRTPLMSSVVSWPWSHSRYGKCKVLRTRGNRG